ncbi:MAG: nucleoside kinase [Clostridia bacterium]|nr:nucleoside kinase [Clostridia bacterium]
MINTLGAINKQVVKNARKFVDLCEKEYREQICSLAKRIADNDDIKIVAIAGPSASGKTTTAHILMNELEKHNEKTAVISLDDFYLPLQKLPFNPDGSRDIESVNAMDIDRIEKAFRDIIDNGFALLPQFDFLTKSRQENAKEINIGSRGIAIVEGLHALNPRITGVVPQKNILKVYISVNTPIEDEDGKRVLTSREVRLIRRVLRDEKFRGAEPAETLSLWNNVIKGESRYLYCFKDTADIKLKTLHPYELCVYKDRFCKMRDSVDENTPCYDCFIRSANALERFWSLDSESVPENSLIREFIGSE